MPQIGSVHQIVPKDHPAESQHWFSQASNLHISKIFCSICSDCRLPLKSLGTVLRVTCASSVRILAYPWWYWCDSSLRAPHLHPSLSLALSGSWHVLLSLRKEFIFTNFVFPVLVFCPLCSTETATMPPHYQAVSTFLFQFISGMRTYSVNKRDLPVFWTNFID